MCWNYHLYLPWQASVNKMNLFVFVRFSSVLKSVRVSVHVCVCVCVCVCQCVCLCLCVSACVCVFALIKFGKWFSDSQIDSVLFPNWPCEFVCVCVLFAETREAGW